MENILKGMVVMKISLVLIPSEALDTDSSRKFHVLSQVLRIAKFSSYSVFVGKNHVFKCLTCHIFRRYVINTNQVDFLHI